MFKKSGKGRMKPFCINENCTKFLPEDKRGYYKKKTAEDGAEPSAEEAKTEKKSAAKKTSTKKTAEKNTKKSSAKKTTTRKTKKEDAAQ